MSIFLVIFITISVNSIKLKVFGRNLEINDRNETLSIALPYANNISSSIISSQEEKQTISIIMTVILSLLLIAIITLTISVFNNIKGLIDQYSQVSLTTNQRIDAMSAGHAVTAPGHIVYSSLSCYVYH
jgi:hypothetical protein